MTIDQALSQLISYGEEINTAYSVLASQPIKPHLPFKIRQIHLANVLDKYLSGDIADDDLSLWAGIIDNQTSIDSSEIEDYLFALINNDMIGGISTPSITKMHALLINNSAN